MKKISVLFVCMGNICRSPMAEGVFNRIIENKGLTDSFIVDSAGIIGYHDGEFADSRMQFHASKRGYKLTHRSRKVEKHDFKKFDFLIAMDEDNIEGLTRLAQTKSDNAKIYRMVDFSTKFQTTHIPDPYYGGDQGFEHVIDLLEDACEGFFEKVKTNKGEFWLVS